LQRRENLAKYAAAVQELARRFLRLIAEGLGFDKNDFFEGDLSGGETLMNVNYYPPCPDPSLTMGIRPHCDRHLLTVLSQGDVSGLQAKHRGRWIRVQPIHNAFVINFGLQMEVSHRINHTYVLPSLIKIGNNTYTVAKLYMCFYVDRDQWAAYKR
jgi:2'-deoxymugineic-acid 2'-dioxygenase/mugineic-acid 3-dioxygenase